MSEVVEPDEATDDPLSPLLVPEAVESFLDSHGLGSGELISRRIGEGRSNVTFLLDRRGKRFVLRRPPRPPLPPSAHDVLREARVLVALERAGIRVVPQVLAVCEDESVLGVPFYVMSHVEGVVVTSELPTVLRPTEQRRLLGFDLVDVLVEIHGVDWEAAGLDRFGKPTGYLERQIRRWSGLWEHTSTRDLPEVEELERWLQANRPETAQTTIVHGDYRLGNILVAPSPPARIRAVLDWEMATLGDPLADLGYLLASYSDGRSRSTPLELSPVTRLEGFPDRHDLALRYAEQTGRSLNALPWYEALALWKASALCEAIYGRYLKGEFPADDSWCASLAAGVPRLLDAATEAAAQA